MGMTTSATQPEVRTIATSVGEEGSEIFCNRELNMNQVYMKLFFSSFSPITVVSPAPLTHILHYD